MILAGRLDRYVLRRFLGYYGLSLLYLVGLFLVLDLVGRLDDFLDARESLAAAGRTVAGTVLAFYAASLPLIVLQVAPFVTVMGACMAVIDLRRGNELYPMMEAGRSLVRILAPVLAFSVAVTAVMVWGHDRLAPRAAEARLETEKIMEGKQGTGATRIPHVRDEAGNTWALGSWESKGMVAERVRVVPFRDGEQVYDLLEAPRLRWRRGSEGPGWYPEDGGKLYLPQGHPSGAASVPLPPERRIPTTLTPEEVDLVRSSEALEGLTGGKLRRLRDRYPDLHYLTVLVHRRYTFPLANLVLLLVGVPLVLRSRGSSLFLSVLAALGVCAGYFVFDSIACDLGGRGVLPSGVATWLGTIVFGAAGVTLMDATRGEW